jgi:predicted RNA binding protein YcfA (HicA-like mRNA interferase family)
MAKLLNHRRAIRLLKRNGWERAGQGRHGVLMKKEGERQIVLPRKGGREYGKGLTQAILKQADLRSKEGAWSSRSSYAKKGRDTGQRSGSSRDVSRQLER